MTTNPNDPMHPNESEQWANGPLPGLTKREWFAGMALQGMLAGPHKHPELMDYAVKARVAADAIIMELNRNPV